MNTQTAGYQNKLLGAVAQTDYTGGFVCLWRRLRDNESENINGESIGGCGAYSRAAFV